MKKEYCLSALIILIFFVSCCEASYNIFNIKIEPETPCIEVSDFNVAPAIIIANKCNESFSFYSYGGENEFNRSAVLIKEIINDNYSISVSPLFNETCSLYTLEKRSNAAKCNNILLPANSDVELVYFVGPGKWYLVGEKIQINGELKLR